MANIPPVDIEDFMERVPMEELIAKFLNNFLKGYQDFINEIVTSISNGDAEDIRENAHKLKGVLANLSMDKGRQLALDLEQRSDTISKEDALKIVGEIEKEIIRLKAYNGDYSELFDEYYDD